MAAGREANGRDGEWAMGRMGRWGEWGDAVMIGSCVPEGQLIVAWHEVPGIMADYDPSRRDGMIGGFYA
jgi:hypothetical protein